MRAMIPGIVVAILFLVTPLDADAQPARRIARLGILPFGTPEQDPNLPTFRQGLSELGYVEGKQATHVIE